MLAAVLSRHRYVYFMYKITFAYLHMCMYAYTRPLTNIRVSTLTLIPQVIVYTGAYTEYYLGSLPLCLSLWLSLLSFLLAEQCTRMHASSPPSSPVRWLSVSIYMIVVIVAVFASIQIDFIGTRFNLLYACMHIHVFVCVCIYTYACMLIILLYLHVSRTIV